jgi:hypothetical protein
MDAILAEILVFEGAMTAGPFFGLGATLDLAAPAAS